MSQEELNSEMLEAAEKGDTDRIWELVEQGADINSARARDGLTALMRSAYYGSLTPELLQVFISNGADINERDKNDNTTLMIAADEDCVTPELARAFANEFIRLGMSLEEIHNQTADINSAAVLVYVLLKKLETEPWIVVDFMKKHVGKKLQEWVDNGVEGANTLVSMLVPHMKKKQTRKNKRLIEIEF